MSLGAVAAVVLSADPSGVTRADALVPALLLGAAVAVLAAPEAAAGRVRGLAVRPPAVGGGSRSGSRWTATVAGAAAVLLAGWAVAGPLAAVLLGAALPAVGAWRARRLQTAQRRRERVRAVEALGGLAGDLQVGRSLSEALAGAADVATGGTRTALLSAAAASRLGGDVPAALHEHAGDSAVADTVRGLAACWQVCAQAGAGLAASVTRLSDGLRAAQAQERAVHAALAGPRASVLVLALLPLAGLALAAALGADPLHVLLGTTPGRLCLAGGAGLEAAGLWWTARIVARAAR